MNLTEKEIVKDLTKIYNEHIQVINLYLDSKKSAIEKKPKNRKQLEKDFSYVLNKMIDDLGYELLEYVADNIVEEHTIYAISKG
jgi:hypothetical protein